MFSVSASEAKSAELRKELTDQERSKINAETMAELVKQADIRSREPPVLVKSVIRTIVSCEEDDDGKVRIPCLVLRDHQHAHRSPPHRPVCAYPWKALPGGVF
mmetsp:Transcript_7168/g.13365  ORF Transcript_7168/g.13365 Transcript_7168/m.13365 type:complete len:103 (+) Transcript_7168:41-349(+)